MSTDKIHIRPFLPGEWPDFKAKRLESLKAIPWVFTSTYEGTIAKPDEWWREMLTSDKDAVFGLFDGAVLVGITGVFTSWVDPMDTTAFLGMSFIDPAYRGKGHSPLLYKARLDWAREKGFEKAFVSHRAGNKASQAANRKFGFRHVRDVEKQFPDGPAISCEYELDLRRRP